MAVAIVGRTGSGKSFTAKGLVETDLQAGASVCVVDPTGVWWGLRLSPDGESPGHPVVIFGGAHADIEITPDQGGEIAGLVSSGRVAQSVIDIAEMSGAEQTRFLTAFIEALFSLNRQPLRLVLDEADIMAPQNPLPEQRRLQGAANKIIRRGRVKGFRPVMITQRPAVIDKSVLSQIDTLIAMRLTSPQDRKAIEDWVKGNADADEARQVIDSLASLSVGEGWYWAPAEGVLERKQFPAISSFDSGRTPQQGDVARDIRPLSQAGLDEIRAVLAAKEKPAIPKAASKVTAPLAEFAAAEQRGYERGKADGYRLGLIDGMDRSREVIAGAMQQLQTPSGKTPEQHRPDPPVGSSKPLPERTSGRNSAGLKPALQRIVNALGLWRHFGFHEIERARACVVAGYSPKASTFGVYIGELVQANLVVASSPGKIALTDAGQQHVRGVDYAGGSSIRDIARGLLKPQEARVFDAIADRWPGEISRGDLADAVGLSRTASTLGVYLGAASSLGLVEVSRPGFVRAVDWIFAGSDLALPSGADHG